MSLLLTIYSAFPLQRLPALALAQVVKQMGGKELLYLLKSSRKMNRLIRWWTKRMSVKLGVKIDNLVKEISFEKEKTYVTFDFQVPFGNGKSGNAENWYFDRTPLKYGFQHYILSHCVDEAEAFISVITFIKTHFDVIESSFEFGELKSEDKFKVLKYTADLILNFENAKWNIISQNLSGSRIFLKDSDIFNTYLPLWIGGDLKNLQTLQLGRRRVDNKEEKRSLVRIKSCIGDHAIIQVTRSAIRLDVVEYAFDRDFLKSSYDDRYIY